MYYNLTVYFVLLNRCHFDIKLKFYFKEQRFIVLSSQATTKIHKHPPCDKATDLPLNSDSEQAQPCKATLRNS